MARHSTVISKRRTVRASRAPGPAGAAALLFSSGSAAAARELAVPVDPVVLKTLSARPSTVRNLVEQFGHLVARTKETGKARGFTISLDAKGNAKFGPLPHREAPNPAKTEDGRLEAALEAARERGRLRSAQILDQNDMLTAEQFAERLGVSRMTVNARPSVREQPSLNVNGHRPPCTAWSKDSADSLAVLLEKAPASAAEV